MTVQWVTKNVTSPVVKWGTSAHALKRVARATSGTYTKRKMLDACGWGAVTPPADAQMTSIGMGWLDPGTIHLAILSGLKYNTTYYYQVTVATLATGRVLAGRRQARANIFLVFVIFSRPAPSLQVTANNPPPHTHVTSRTHSFTTAPAPGSNQALTIL